MEHTLKINTKFYSYWPCGDKTSETRVNDRNFELGDTVTLQEVDVVRTGRELPDLIITHIVSHEDFPEGIPPGYVCLSLQRYDKAGGYWQVLSDDKKAREEK